VVLQPVARIAISDVVIIGILHRWL
jgi:hypothetical protein